MAGIVDPRRLIEEVPFTVAGREVTVGRYSTPNRRTGARIVATYGGVILFDTDDCYDFANASNRFENWVREEEAKLCAHCGRADRDYDFEAQDAQSGRRLCDQCAAKGLGPDRLPSPVMTPSEEPVGAVPGKCPF